MKPPRTSSSRRVAAQRTGGARSETSSRSSGTSRTGSSSRTASSGSGPQRPSSQRLKKAQGSAAARRPAPAIAEEFDDEDDVADAPAGRRGAGGGAGRRSAREVKPSKAPWFIGGFIVLAVIGIAAYGPVRRSMLLSTLDGSTGSAAIEAADAYLIFEKGRETAVRAVIVTRRGPFNAQLHLAERTKSLACIALLVDRGDLEDEQLVETLNMGTSLFSNDRDRDERPPRKLAEWAEKHENRDIANAALALQVRFAAVGVDTEETTALLSRIAADPAQDPLRAQAALDGLATLIDTDTLGHALTLLRGATSDLVLAHQALTQAIRTNARAGHLPDLLGLLDHPTPAVRALALDCMGRLTLPDNADPSVRRNLGERVSAKLISDTPPVELAAALGAVKNLRLSGASEAVLALAKQREALALPGIDDGFWIICLGDSFILTTPEAARADSERIIGRLAESVPDPVMRPIAAGALGRIRDAGFLSLRPGMDALAGHLDEDVCRDALVALVGKTFAREDVIKACGNDADAWRDFLAKDRPRYERVAAIRTFVDANRATQRISDGRAKLGEIKTFLEAARDEMQGWLDDAKFVAPLGLTRSQIEGIFRDVQELNVSVRKAYSGAL